MLQDVSYLGYVHCRNTLKTKGLLLTYQEVTAMCALKGELQEPGTLSLAPFGKDMVAHTFQTTL